MAAVKTEQERSLRVRVETGTTSSGAAKISNRTISNINPELAVDDVYTIGAAIAALQTYPLNELQTVDTAVITEDA